MDSSMRIPLLQILMLLLLLSKQDYYPVVNTVVAVRWDYILSYEKSGVCVP